MSDYRNLLPALLLLCLSGCATEGDRKLPGVYRIDIQQGNVIEQEMLDKLRPGMDKNQVRFIMGTPVIADPFHTDRWDYIYTYSEGGSQRQQRHISIFFKDDKLDYVKGDVVIGEKESSDDDMANTSKTVDVPLKTRKDSIFGKIMGSIPFIGDDEPHSASEEKEQDTPHNGPDEDD